MERKSGSRWQGPRRKVGAFAILFALLTGLFGVAASTASAVVVGSDTINGFEVDGNEVVNTAGNFDWKSPSPTAQLMTLTDENNPDFGFKGSSKENDPLNWQCQSHAGGITPGKDNLLRTYISTDIGQDSATLGLAFVRAAGSSSGPNGDTHVNFELDRGAITFNATQANGPCPYVGRLPGDLLLSFAFPGNGSATVTAYTWDGSSWVEFAIPGGVVNLVAATDNAAAIAAADDIGGGDIPIRAFGEAAINLKSLDDLTSDSILSCPGFGHVSIRSRASGESFDSALQDHMGGDIDLSTCGKVIVHKTDDAGTPLAGVNFGLYSSHADAQAHTNPVATCVSVADGSCTFDKVPPADYYVSETPPAPSGYGIDPTIVGPITVGFRQTVDVTSHTFVDPRDTGFVRVVKALVDQSGAPVTPSDLSKLNGAAFLLYSDANNNSQYDVGEAVHLWPNPPADGTDLAACTITDGSGTCEIGPVATGSYRVTETAVPPLTNKGDDVPVTVTKSTALAPVSVTYTNVLNPLQIHLDKSGPATSNIGDVFTYTFAVTTSGPPLHDISVVELAPDRCNNGPITGPVKTGGDQDAFLEVNETWTYTCSHLTTPADGTSLVNNARATGTDDFGRTVSDDDDHTVTILYPDLRVVKTATPATVNTGANAGYSITTTNIGQGTARNVTLTDTLPAGTWTIGGADGASCSGTSGTMTCSFGTLASGASRTVTLTRPTAIADCGTLPNSVSVATTYGGANIDVDTTNNTSSATVTVTCPDVEVHKTAEASSISAGDTARFTITVHNLGSGAANGVTVSDPLPPVDNGWVIDSQTSGMGCTVGTSLTCGPFDLGPDATATVVISAVTVAADCGTLPNTVQIAVTGGDTNAANNTSSASITVLCPHLGITKTADAASVSAGDPIGFTITVTNSGQGVAKGVALDDPLPSGVTWAISAPVPQGCAIDTGALSCPIGDMAAGSSFTVHITAPTTASDCKAYENTATADGSNTDPVHATASTLVLCPGLNLLKTSDAPSVDAGQQIGFTITVANASGNAVGVAKAVTVDDPLPTGAGIAWSIHDTSGVDAKCAITNGTLACGPVDLAPGQSFAVHIVSDTPGGLTNANLPAACKAYDNTATADATNAAELTASASTEVVCPLAIQLVKDGPATAFRGDTVTYTFTVTNIGKVDLMTVDLSDAKCDAGTITKVDDGDGDAVLEIGESWRYTCTRVIRADDPDPLPNTATVLGTDIRNRTTTASASHVIDLLEPQVLEVEAFKELPHTGIDAGRLSMLAVTLGLTGCGMVIVANRRRRRYHT